MTTLLTLNNRKRAKTIAYDLKINPDKLKVKTKKNSPKK